MEYINLCIFWTAMLITAGLVLVGIWFEQSVPEWVFKLAGTFFVIGLANFLLWGPQVIYRFLYKTRNSWKFIPLEIGNQRFPSSN